MIDLQEARRRYAEFLSGVEWSDLPLQLRLMVMGQAGGEFFFYTTQNGLIRATPSRACWGLN